MRRIAFLSVAAAPATLIIVAVAVAVAAGGLGIAVNGGGEIGPTGSDDSAVVAPSGWTTVGNFTAVKYGSPGLPGTAAATPIHGGVSLFAGGPNNASSSASQTVKIPAAMVRPVAGGHVSASLTADLGGWEGQPDAATVQYQFLDGSGSVLLAARLGPVTPAQRGNVTGLKAVSKTVAVPAGTRTVKITISAIRGSGAYNDGYADNVALNLVR